MGSAAATARAVIFDGDDTLWSTEALYDQARDDARAIVRAAGGDAGSWERLQRRIDVENVAILGYSQDRFPTSCVQAYEQLCAGTRAEVDRSIATRIRDAAASVFARDAPLVPGASLVLAALQARGIRLALLTKGDDPIQSRRVERSGLRHHFDLVRIVPDKTPDVVRAVVSALDAPLDAAWMVGNSMRSDILPALDAGIHAIWIRSHVWEHERSSDHVVDDRVVVVSGIGEVPAIVAGV